jgi:hypothetical protein
MTSAEACALLLQHILQLSRARADRNVWRLIALTAIHHASDRIRDNERIRRPYRDSGTNAPIPLMKVTMPVLNAMQDIRWADYLYRLDATFALAVCDSCAKPPPIAQMPSCVMFFLFWFRPYLMRTGGQRRALPCSADSPYPPSNFAVTHTEPRRGLRGSAPDFSAPPIRPNPRR